MGKSIQMFLAVVGIGAIFGGGYYLYISYDTDDVIIDSYININDETIFSEISKPLSATISSTLSSPLSNTIIKEVTSNTVEDEIQSQDEEILLISQ